MNRWICDSCGQEITSVEDGWIEWISLDSGMIPSGRGLRLVHKSPSCQYNQKAEHRKDGGILSDSSLSDFLGSDGLMRLLQFLSEEEVPKSEALELIKRLHIPGYEHARMHFEEAIRRGVFVPGTPQNYYHQSDIEATLRYMQEKRE